MTSRIAKRGTVSDARVGEQQRQVELLDVLEVDQDDLLFHY
jgi:hypothetical protein